MSRISFFLLCVCLLCLMARSAQAQVAEESWKDALNARVAVEVNNGYTYSGLLRELRPTEVVVVDDAGRVLVIQKKDAISLKLVLAVLGTGVPEPAESTEAPKDPALELQKRELRQDIRKVSLGGPIAMTAVGGGMFIAGAALGVQFLAIGSACDDDFDDCDPLRAVAGFFLAIAAIGGGLGIGGGIWLGRRMAERRELKQQLRDLGYQQTPAPAGPRHAVGLMLPRGGAGLRWSFQF